MENIIEKFTLMAVEDGEANETGNYRVVNKLYKEFQKIFKIIESEGNQQIEVYKSLLENDSKYVRYKSAARCLALGILIDDSVQVLNKIITSEKSTLSFNSKMVLKVWYEGKLKK